MEALVRAATNGLECERATVFLLDEFKGELWSRGADETLRVPMEQGIVGSVVRRAAAGEA